MHGFVLKWTCSIGMSTADSSRVYETFSFVSKSGPLSSATFYASAMLWFSFCRHCVSVLWCMGVTLFKFKICTLCWLSHCYMFLLALCYSITSSWEPSGMNRSLVLLKLHRSKIQPVLLICWPMYVYVWKESGISHGCSCVHCTCVWVCSLA